MTETTLGAKVKRLRLEQGLTQGELSAKAGVSKTYICLVENGKFKARVDMIAKVAKALNVDFEELYKA